MESTLEGPLSVSLGEVLKAAGWTPDKVPAFIARPAPAPVPSRTPVKSQKDIFETKPVAIPAKNKKPIRKLRIGKDGSLIVHGGIRRF